jgi:hypothetical protein
MLIPAEAEEGIPMLVDPATTDDLEVLKAKVFDLRDLYRIAPSPAATKADEDEENDESGDDTDDSDDDSSDDSDESGEDDEDEDDKASTAKLIKDLREENKARRLKLRAANRDLEKLKAENARLKRNAKGNTRKKADDADEEDDEQEEDPTKLTTREKQVELKDSLLDVMGDLDINRKNKRLILALIDEDEVDFEVSDTGKVKVSGLKEAVEDLLEDYPEWKNQTEDDDEEDGKTRRISSGNRKKKGSGNGLDQATLAKKYPALASR